METLSGPPPDELAALKYKSEEVLLVTIFGKLNVVAIYLFHKFIANTPIVPT